MNAPAENPHTKAYASVKEMPTDVLASRFVESLILAEGNLNKVQEIAAEMIRQVRGAGSKRGIYIASKVKHASRWRFLRDQIGYPIISTWIDEAGEGESKDKADLWRRCISEAANAKVLVLNREPDEVLKGGWIELGAALSADTPVLAVGIEEFTVAHDRRIRHFPHIRDAMAEALSLANAS